MLTTCNGSRVLGKGRISRIISCAHHGDMVPSSTLALCFPRCTKDDAEWTTRMHHFGTWSMFQGVTPYLARTRQHEKSPCRTTIQNAHYFSTSNSNDDDVKCSPSPKGGAAGRKAFLLRHELEQQKQQHTPSSMTTMATFLSHAGLPPSPTPNTNNNTNENAALCTPLEFATTYQRPPDGNYTSAGNIYGRTDNITRETLQYVVGTMEIMSDNNNNNINNSLVHSVSSAPPDSCNNSTTNEETNVICAAFSSGMAAVHSILLSLMSNHTHIHILLPDDAYHGVPTQFHTLFDTMKHVVSWTMVDMTDIHQVEQLLRTRIKENRGRQREAILVWMETPSNPLCKVTDIGAICDMVNMVRKEETDDDDDDKEQMITTVVDSTWAPPCITQPILVSVDKNNMCVCPLCFCFCCCRHMICAVKLKF